MVTRLFRLPMFVIAAALLGLIALLATLQYQWLGRVSDAEREHLAATLTDQSSAFAEDVDGDLTRAYLLFQIDLSGEVHGLEGDLAARYDRWQATARFPRLIKAVYLVTGDGADSAIRRFDPTSRAIEPSAWPSALAPIRAGTGGTGGSRLLQDVPAIVIPSAVLVIEDDFRVAPERLRDPSRLLKQAGTSRTVLLLDADYIRQGMLPALTERHFRGGADAVRYRVAIVPASGAGPAIYQSDAGDPLGATAPADARIDLFRVRVQDFSTVASEVTRFATFTTRDRISSNAQHTRFSIIVQETGRGRASIDKLLDGTAAGNIGASVSVPVATADQPAGWKLLVQHPSGSLERAVNAARRRNLAISSGILGVLGLSISLLFVSTRRAQDLARQQLEFVATVSHELRTPLAVIRSAGDNLADGVIHDEARVREYGELVRREGVRLTDLVERILEFAGLQSGRRTLVLQSVPLASLLSDVAATAKDAAREPVAIDLATPGGLPAVCGDVAALRRVFQNLIDNAIKYGGDTRWVGIDASAGPSTVAVTIRDRGIGIGPADQERIFDPFYRAADVISAQIHGAGLGLSLVKRIVEAHGGRLTVVSAPGAGSAFTVTLPIASGGTPEPPVAATAAQHP